MNETDGWKKTKTILITTLILLMSLPIIRTTEPIIAAKIYVESIDSLQEKINNSSNDDIIQINESINLTNFIIINKSITLTGKPDNSILIDGCGYGFNITTSNVTFTNLSITNGSTLFLIKNETHSLENISLVNLTIRNSSQKCISMYNSTNSIITNSNIFNCLTSGIYLYNSTNITISNNFINQTDTSLNITHHSDNNIIYNNTFDNNIISINITRSDHNTIYNNTFFNKTRYHAFDNSSNNWNTSTHGNYWDDYNGTNCNDDIYGNVNYSINGGTATDEKPLGFFKPIVNFTYEPTSPTTENTIIFSDHSIDPNTENNVHLNYSWNFGDENLSYQQNPTHRYENNDITYNVTLVVTNQYNQSNQTSLSIIINNSAPISLFSWVPNPGIVNETISFIGNCNDIDGDIITWFWDFGDNSNSTQQNSTQHMYTQSGQYPVLLNITDNDGNTSTYSHMIDVTYRPTANFSINTSNPTTSDTVNLTDSSIDLDGSIASWSWDFDDNNGIQEDSTEQNPHYSYTDNGTYTITLNITDNTGATNQTSQTITVLNTPPTANFTYTPHSATDLQTITFNNCSVDTDGYITNCVWTFGDGVTNNSMNVTSHQYTDDGIYTVTLNVTDNDGDTDEISRNITIANVKPTADFTFEPSNPEVGETIWFNDTSTDNDGTIVNWSWDFGDDSTNTSRNTTHSCSTLESYNITLIVTDDDGNTSSETKNIILKQTTIKEINSKNHLSYNLKSEANADITIKTSNTTNLSITRYSECPTGINPIISDYKNLETYLDISLENETLLNWINVSFYYTDNDLIENIDENSVTLFYWNESAQQWIPVSESILKTSNFEEYSGYVQTNLSHLTLFTLAGKIIEEEESIQPTLPIITNSSNSTTFKIATPTINVTYNKIVPSISAVFNGTDLPLSSTDNKTFSCFIYSDLSNGNYTIQLHISNGTISRTDVIRFTVFLPPTSQKTNNEPIHIPVWIWYGLLLFVIMAFFWIFNIKSYVSKSICDKKQRRNTELSSSINTKDTKKSQRIIQDTVSSFHQSLKSFDTLLFGDYDPWEQEKNDINQTLFNIDLFANKPDAYVSIQQRLLTEEPTCKKIINFLEKDKNSIHKIKEKTKISTEELGNQLSILMKYGLIEEQKKDNFQLTRQAKKILEKKKE